MKLSLKDQNSKKIGDIQVDDSVFKAVVKPEALSTYVYCYLSNQRESNAHTKDRSEVRGGGRKPWRQKGTGRARHGSSRSPIWKGGGVTFGPRNERNYKKKMTKKFKRNVLRQAFSHLIANNQLDVIEDITLDVKKPLTKQALDVKNKFDAKTLTIVLPKKNETMMQAFGNIQNANVIQIGELSAYDLLTGGRVLLHQDCLGYIKNHWVKK